MGSHPDSGAESNPWLQPIAHILHTLAGLLRGEEGALPFLRPLGEQARLLLHSSRRLRRRLGRLRLRRLDRRELPPQVGERHRLLVDRRPDAVDRRLLPPLRAPEELELVGDAALLLVDARLARLLLLALPPRVRLLVAEGERAVGGGRRRSTPCRGRASGSIAATCDSMPLYSVGGVHRRWTRWKR